MKKAKVRNPISRSIIIFCAVFTLVFALVIGIMGCLIFKSHMMDQYRSHISGVLELTLTRINVEDLEKCIESKEESEEFKELNDYMDQARQKNSLESLIIVVPIKKGDKYDIMEVATGLYPEERAGIDQKEFPIPVLGEIITGYLPEGFPQMVYQNYINSHEITYLESSTAFGNTYDAMVSIRNKKDEPVALLITSVSLKQIDDTMKQYIKIMAVSTILLSIVFIAGMVLWMRRRIIVPLKKIEETAEDFEEKSRDRKDPEALVLKNESIHTGDEMELLADSLAAMSQNMKAYVEELIQSAVEVERMRQEVIRANDLAMRDALTGVKNKAAYDQQSKRLDLDIKAGDAEFAIIMIDINDLKHINDNYGHEKGNIYIKKMCTMICDTFAHSPVFRVGGDEFIVVLIHRDYENKEMLISDIKAKMTELASHSELDEWMRPAAAMGLGIYDRDLDRESDSVLKRADKAMYENKKKMKGQENVR